MFQSIFLPFVFYSKHRVMTFNFTLNKKKQLRKCSQVLRLTARSLLSYVRVLLETYTVRSSVTSGVCTDLAMGQSYFLHKAQHIKQQKHLYIFNQYNRKALAMTHEGQREITFDATLSYSDITFAFSRYAGFCRNYSFI
jgi:hypothetical protein